MADGNDYGKIIVLTGAGASAALGLPTMKSFRRLISDTAALSDMADDIGLPEERVELEAIYDRLQLYVDVAYAGLSDRNLQSFIIPPSEHAKRRLELAGTHGPMGNPELDRFQRLLERSRAALRELQHLILQTYGLVDAQEAERVYGKLLAGCCEVQKCRLHLFTTNYDLTFEHLTSSFPGNALVNGLRPESVHRWVWDPSTYQSSPDSARLLVYRLHGCSHWFFEPSGEVFHYPHPPLGQASLRPMVIFPSKVKTEQIHGGPFVVAYRAFRKALIDAQVCVIIGYSFRDPGIQEALADARDPAQFIVVDPNLGGDDLARVLGSRRVTHIRGWFGHKVVNEAVLVTCSDALAGVELPQLVDVYEETKPPT